MSVFIKSDNEIIVGDEYVLSKQELMDKLCVSRGTIQRWQKKGLPFAEYSNRLNGYCLATVLEWLEANGYPNPLVAAEIRSRKRMIKKE